MATVLSKSFPFYSLVPKGLLENIEYRNEVRSRAEADHRFRRDIVDMCRADILFWINVFVYTFDPRLKPPHPTTVPFVSYPFQDDAIEVLTSSLGVEDVVICKSRDMGASWLCLLVFLHSWQFSPHRVSFMLVSRTESLVDKTEDMDALMPKLDFALDAEPYWLVPRYSRTKLHLFNEETKSVIDGVSTTGNVGRGGRRSCVLMDEHAAFERSDGYEALAATQKNTNCRFFNSTPQGVANAYYDMWKNPHTRKLSFHWSEHPVQNRGLYTSKNGKLEIMDEEYEYPKDYQFILDGKLRSPYYDGECRRTPVDSLIAQELDMDFLGSGSPFFTPDEIKKAELEQALSPFDVGHLEVDSESGKGTSFTSERSGQLRLWLHLVRKKDGDVPPDDRRYVVGADIAVGSGASDSCLSVLDTKTGEKVAEYVNSHINPVDFADLAVGLSWWFNGAFLIWEENGPGLAFGLRVVEKGYSNIYYRPKDISSMKKKLTDKPGWFSTPKSKKALLTSYGTALATGDFVNRSKEAIREMGFFVYLADNSIGHVQAQGALDPTGNKDNHGDRVIADALAWHGMKERPDRRKEERPAVPVGSMAWRRQKRKFTGKPQVVRVY